MLDSVDAFLEAAAQMNERTMSVSIGGMALISLLWAAYYGLKDDWNLKGFRWPGFLAAPFFSFLSAFLILQIEFYSSSAGFRSEVMRGKWKDENGWHQIFDPAAHFVDQYAKAINQASAISLILGILGVVLISTWFLLNIFALWRKKDVLHNFKK